MSTVLDVAAESQTGHVRSGNEDSYVAGQHVWAVADGMGGQAAGAVASRIAVRCVQSRDESGPLDQIELGSLLDLINQRILAYGHGHPKAAGLGTTLAGVALTSLAGQSHWLVFNVGDSRVYRLTDGRLRRETVDHSEVQSLIDHGEITFQEARSHPQRNILTRCLGSVHTPKADIKLVPCLPGDRFLICSDGLTGEIDDGIIRDILLEARTSRQATEALVGAALEQGGRDNITVVVVGVDDVDDDLCQSLVEHTLPKSEIESQ